MDAVRPCQIKVEDKSGILPPHEEQKNMNHIENAWLRCVRIRSNALVVTFSKPHAARKRLK